MLHVHRTAIARLIVALCLCVLSVPAQAELEMVSFQSADGKTQLVGYLFKPDGAGPHPAIVLLHGRAGPYSANSNADCTFVTQTPSSPCNASRLSKRHAMWGQCWADHGYVALLAPAITTTVRLAVFLAEDDEEVSPDFCLKLADRSRAAGTAIDVTLYPRATHDFDDPGERRQSSRGNQAAKADAMAKALAITQAAANER